MLVQIRSLVSFGMSVLLRIVERLRETWYFIIQFLFPSRKIARIQGSRMYLNRFEKDRQMRKVFRIYARNRINEKSSTAIFCQALEKNDVVVDLGANIGYYTLLAAKQV